ncbi:MAG: response regulator [Clostridiales bacterium]|nr:response regulator [Clostridiales bacterium]MDU3243373.1 response regulator [Clostridiales bacterium]
MLQICLCDDDKTIANRFMPMIRDILKNHPAQITYLKSGESFLFHFRENPNFMDIILMDIEMGKPTVLR